MTDQTEQDFKSHLNEQINFLARSASSYDEGYEGEAKRMAVVMHALIHDTQSSTSLLTLLKKKDILFYDTANKQYPHNPVPTIGLVIMQVGPEGAKYIPLLCGDIGQNRKVPFQKWWDKIVIAYTRNNKLTRRDIILKAAHKDEEAYMDQRLNEDYVNLIKFSKLEWKYDYGEEKENIPGMELASIRQITYEVLQSLKDEFPEYF